MAPRLFAKIALRVVAAYLMAEGVSHLPQLASLDNTRFADDFAISAMFYAIVFGVAVLSPLLVGLYLWWLAPRAAVWLVGKEEADGAGSLDIASLQTAAFITVGVIIAVSALPNILGIFLSSFYKDLPAGFPSPLHNSRFLAEIFRFLFGVVFILGARFFTRLFRRFREF